MKKITKKKIKSKKTKQFGQGGSESKPTRRPTNTKKNRILLRRKKEQIKQEQIKQEQIKKERIDKRDKKKSIKDRKK